MTVSLPDIVRQKVALTHDRDSSPGAGSIRSMTRRPAGRSTSMATNITCFACGAHGDAISFLIQTKGGNFPIAVGLLAGAQGGSLQ
ncbi:MAG: CHC2 zinc finger domain-containing protein [Rhodopila sp.]